MTILEQIKAEIERLENYYTSVERHIEELLSFLDTLEEEFNISPWKKVHTYTEEIHEGDVEKMLSDLSVGEGEKWNKIALPDRVVDALEEPVSDDLEEAAKKHSCYDEDCEGVWYEPIVRDAFIAGAKWQKEQYHFFNKAWAENMQTELDRNYENGKQAMKEQMMKEAVEGQVFGATDVKALYEGKVYVISNLVQDTDYNLYPNDKVRIIIVKE